MTRLLPGNDIQLLVCGMQVLHILTEGFQMGFGLTGRICKDRGAGAVWMVSAPGKRIWTPLFAHARSRHHSNGTNMPAPLTHPSNCMPLLPPRAQGVATTVY